ncbi:N-acetylmuramic acid 6-phosphate etherase/phosphogluconate dehydratase [Acididesulfobacillus acetoxydans]|uniref:N-acetylmuramic acid 6-phosphate etherase n=1 Tax=Acididesulfobacillus acetoxydans TaxID=1561005 RepID=A0A8S0W459_9FIRM|nr:N-acetylmuramic acid 6-phosphate etherase [Acididesulfobacillus acetoxydans]CAA7602258.1 N-acetylmuramic acid 6-phosphate etherase/phosphogluconate dehydratase [Acididesulfobacillus acetoxydans]CEJ07524.1 N-acetylmuramic acid 6-phosphate etherase 2 [Acididesulfobacillus acetoxydans]
MESIWELQTEQSDPRYADLDISTTRDLLHIMNEADLTVPLAVSQALPAVECAVDLIVTHLKCGGRLIYIGAGTSGRIGVLDAAECPPTFRTSPDQVIGLIAGGRRAMFDAVEQAEDEAITARADLEQVHLCADDVVVGLTASGRTPYVVGGLKYAKMVGSGTVAVSCNPHAAASQYADVPIEVSTGPEVLSGSTRLKAGTAEKLIVNMLSTASMFRLGKVYHNLMVDLKVTNRKLLKRARHMVMTTADVDLPTAERVLKQANDHVKTAILMAKTGVDKSTAEAKLADADGILRIALGEANNTVEGAAANRERKI